jgi:hypothetical protein
MSLNQSKKNFMKKSLNISVWFGLAQQNGFGSPFLHKMTRLAKSHSKALTPAINWLVDGNDWSRWVAITC